MAHYSPLSSIGNFQIGSAQGTPDTHLTEYSPDGPRPPRADENVPVKGQTESALHDPFVTTVQSQLSATAPSFSMSVPIPAANADITSALSQQRKKLDGIVQQVKSSNEAASVRVPAAQKGDVNHSGTFSTDTDATRCISIKATRRSVASVPEVVSVALEVCVLHSMQ
jgi:hypothetical protein